MLWVIVADVVAVLGGLAVLGVIGLSLWRRVQRLGGQVSEVGERMARVSADLDRLSAQLTQRTGGQRAGGRGHH